MAQAAAATKAVGTTVTSTDPKLARARQGFQTLGLAGVAVGGALAAGFAVSAKAAIDFESSFAGVRKTVDASEAEFTALAQGMRDLAKEIPVNVNELNRIGEAAGQLGIKKSAILGFTEVVAKMGVTTDLTSDAAANAFARIGNIMQTSQSEFDRMGATIVALGNAGASTESEITEMALRIGGAADVVGMSEAQVLGFASALSSVGIRAEAGGSSISRTFIEIATAVDQGGAKLEMFAKTAGVSVDEFRTLFQEDAAGATVAFIEGLGKIDAAGGSVFQTLDALGLSEIRVRDALLRASGAGHLFRESLELGSRAWEENSALNEEAAKRFETTASKIQLAKNEVNDLAISVGDLIKGGLEEGVVLLGDFAGALNDLPGPAKTAATALAATAAAVALLGGGALLALPHIVRIKAALDLYNISLSASALAMRALPLAVLVGGYVLLKDRVDSTAESVSKLSGTLRTMHGLHGGAPSAPGPRETEGYRELAAMVRSYVDVLAQRSIKERALADDIESTTGINERAFDAQSRINDAIMEVNASLKEMGVNWQTASPAELQTALANLYPALRRTGEAAAEAGGHVAKFAGMGPNKFAKWSDEVMGSLDGVEMAFGRLAGDMNVSAAEWDKAMRRTLRVLTNYEDNLSAVEKRDIPDALLQQLLSMGTEGAGILELLAKASDKEFKKMVGDLKAVEGGTKDLGAAIRELPDRANVSYHETGLDEMLAKVERYSAAIREMPAAVSTSFQGSGTGKRPADFGAVVQGPATVQIGNIRELVHFTPLSGPGASGGRFSGHVTVDLQNGRGWLELTLDDMARRP